MHIIIIILGVLCQVSNNLVIEEFIHFRLYSPIVTNKSIHEFGIFDTWRYVMNYTIYKL